MQIILVFASIVAMLVLQTIIESIRSLVSNVSPLLVLILSVHFCLSQTHSRWLSGTINIANESSNQFLYVQWLSNSNFYFWIVSVTGTAGIEYFCFPERSVLLEKRTGKVAVWYYAHSDTGEASSGYILPNIHQWNSKGLCTGSLFDVITNIIGLVAALLANYVQGWIDPVGAIH